jgi:hypothetical protein
MSNSSSLLDYIKGLSKRSTTLNLKINSIDRLVQEHAIYKQFFTDIINRPRNGGFSNYWKVKAFDARDRIDNLDSNVPYYDPSWVDADTVLFSLTVGDVEL